MSASKTTLPNHRLSIVKLAEQVSTAAGSEELKTALMEICRRIENHVNNGNKVVIHNDPLAHYPTLKKGDIVIDTASDPNGEFLMFQSDGRKPQEKAFSTAAVTTASVYGEVPSGNADGTNTAFTLTKAPTANTTRVFANGQRKVKGIDYVETSTGLKFLSAPAVGTKIVVDYGYAK